VRRAFLVVAVLVVVAAVLLPGTASAGWLGPDAKDVDISDVRPLEPYRLDGQTIPNCYVACFTVRNKATRHPLNLIRFSVYGSIEGRSTEYALKRFVPGVGYTDSVLTSDRILAPGESHEECAWGQFSGAPQRPHIIRIWVMLAEFGK
jgi:hypothetical protein